MIQLMSAIALVLIGIGWGIIGSIWTFRRVVRQPNYWQSFFRACGPETRGAANVALCEYYHQLKRELDDNA